MSEDQAQAQTQEGFAPREVWGFMEEGVFVPLPRVPFDNAGMTGPTPFEVDLPLGRKRMIITQPAALDTQVVE